MGSMGLLLLLRRCGLQAVSVWSAALARLWGGLGRSSMSCTTTSLSCTARESRLVYRRQGKGRCLVKLSCAWYMSECIGLLVA